MLSSLLALALTAAPPAPPSLDGASATILVARLDRMGRMVSFLERAGRHSVILRPASWQGDLHPLLSFDPTRPDSISAAGIDPAAGLSISLFPEGRVTCLSLSDPSRYEPPAQARLAGLGAVGRARDAGASVVVAAVKGKAVAGYVIRGRHSCAAEGPRADELLRKAAKALSKPPGRAPWASTASAEDSAYVVSRRGSVQITGKLDVLEVRGTIQGGRDLPGLKPAGPSPYGGVAPSGLLMLRARATPDGVRRALGRAGAQLLASCELCNAGAVGSLVGHLRDQLTGEVMLRVDRVQVPPGSLRSVSARYFGVKHAYLAEVSRPEVVSAALESLLKLGAVRTAEDAYSLTAGTGAGAGTLLAGLSGRHLYLANDEEALKAALDAATAAAARPAPMEHGADLFVDPKGVARAFRQVSLLDLMSSRDLAPVVAAGTELGPLLAHSERLTGWVDGDGPTRRFSFSWKLASEPAPAPAQDAASGR